MSEKNKPTPEEVQEWLDNVHFGSCCSDPLIASLSAAVALKKVSDPEKVDAAIQADRREP